MEERICKGTGCDRPLTEEDDDYCPRCRAKRAGEVGKSLGIAGAITAGITAVASVTIVAVGFIIKTFVTKES